MPVSVSVPNYAFFLWFQWTFHTLQQFARGTAGMYLGGFFITSSTAACPGAIEKQGLMGVHLPGQVATGLVSDRLEQGQ
jgi:hypothetical protein